MVIDYIGSTKRRFHKDCHGDFIIDKEFKEKEKAELDSLIETIKDLHKLKTIPRQFYPYINDLRNGNELFGKVGKKKSKEGYEYSVIEATYKDMADGIKWSMNNKKFNDSLHFLKYTYGGIRKRIARVDARIQNERRQLENINNRSDLVDSVESGEWTYTNEENNRDISNLLD